MILVLSLCVTVIGLHWKLYQLVKRVSVGQCRTGVISFRTRVCAYEYDNKS